MIHRGPIAKAFAILLVVAVPSLCVPTSAQDRATLAGTIYGADTERPVEGAVLHAGDLRSGEIYSTAITGSDGGFVLTDLPAAAYELAVERDGGLFLVGAPVQLAAGQKRDVQVAIHAEAAPDPATATRKKRGFWDRPGFATIVVIGAAFVFGALVSAADDTNEGIASPYTN